MIKCIMFCLMILNLLLLFNYSSAAFTSKDSKNYGPYYVEYKTFDVCRGPKLVNLTTYTARLSIEENNMYRGLVNLTFLEQTVIEEVKMSVFAINEKRKSLLWNYIVVRPCQHFALTAVLETYVGAKNCVVKKGTYNCNLNFSEIIYNYLGTSFFYGEFMFKAVVLSKKGNIICLMFNPDIKKKN